MRNKTINKADLIHLPGLESKLRTGLKRRFNMSNNIPFENFESFDQQTLLNYSYLAIIPVRFLIMPKHLELTERPELNDFPANILFAETFDDPRKLEIRGALYEPDLATFEVKDGQKHMLYRNAHGGDSQVRVIRAPDGGYTGVRIIQGADKSFAMGATWKDFFLHLTLTGTFPEEAFVSVPISSINEAFPSKPQPKILTHEGPEDRVNADRKEAVEYREKAKKEPDLFLPKLARSLSNLGLSLSELGQKDEAVKVTLEAVEISRCLNEDPPLNRPILLGVILNNLGNRLYEQGKVKEALEPTREAEIIFRELTTKYDGNSKADLARSLNDIGLYLNELGKHEDGLKTTLEAVEVSRQLVKENPKRFNTYLASGLNILEKIYNGLGLKEEAHKADQELEEISKKKE